MQAKQESSIRATLAARQKALLRDLAHVQQEIVQAERVQVRLEDRIRILEQDQRRAA